MITEIICVSGIIAFLVLLIKERDWKYIIGFTLGFLGALWLETRGVLNGYWTWENIIAPFNYLLFSVPICVHLIYASGGALGVFITKYFVKLRETEKNSDKIIGYASIMVGIILFILSMILGGKNIHDHHIGLTFIVAGLFILVKNPVIFYVGAISLAADLIIEYLIMFNMQISYTVTYDIGVGFFLGGAILSAMILLLEKRKKIFS